jgi:NitT/TauT family transport system permease protein
VNTAAFTTPNLTPPRETARLILIGWAVVWLAYWTVFRPVIVPSPLEVLSEWPRLWFEEGLGAEMFASLRVSIEALVVSSVVSLTIAYLSRVPIVRPLALAIAQLRFLSPVVFFFLLLKLVGAGHAMKVYMLALGEAFFLTTTMIGVVDAVPLEALDDARTLRMNEWQVTWYAVVRGTIDQALLAIRDNNAMGWSMLMMVEGVVRSEGGIGVLITDQEKHMNFGAVYAIAISVVLVGFALDQAIVWLRRSVCPWVRA